MSGRDTAPAPRPWRQWPLLVVVGGLAVGLVITVLSEGSWRLGCLVIGGSLALGAVERAALPRRDAGLLQVRSRAFDVAVMALAAAGIITLAIAVPPRR